MKLILEEMTESSLDLFNKARLPENFQVNEQFLKDAFGIPSSAATVIVQKLNQMGVLWGTFRFWGEAQLQQVFGNSVQDIYLLSLPSRCKSYERAQESAVKSALLAQESALLAQKKEVIAAELKLEEFKMSSNSKRTYDDASSSWLDLAANETKRC
jgi:hypothetical protein